MSWRRFWHRRRDVELSQEIESYIAHEVDDNLARGMSADESRAAAQRKFGNPTLVKETVYEMHPLHPIESLRQDVTFGLRQLWRNPAFAGTSILNPSPEQTNGEQHRRIASCPPSASAAPPSSRRAGSPRRPRPPTRPSTTCVTGSWAPTASGPPWAFLPTAPTAFRRHRSSASQSPPRTANTRWSKAWKSISSAKSAST